MQIVLKPSRLLAVTLITAHSLAASAVVLARLPLWLEAVAIIAIVVSLVLGLVKALHKTDAAITAIQFSEEGVLNVRNRHGDWIECAVLDSTTYVAPFLTVLNLRPLEGRGTKYVPILPDAVPPEDFRALRIWLRWKARPNAQEHFGESGA